MTKEWEECYRKKYMMQRKSQGVCVRCGKEKAAPGKVLCPACGEEERLRSKENYAWCKKKGVCVRCRKNKAATGYTECEECASKRRAKYREKRDAGIKRD